VARIALVLDAGGVKCHTIPSELESLASVLGLPAGPRHFKGHLPTLSELPQPFPSCSRLPLGGRL